MSIIEELQTVDRGADVDDRPRIVLTMTTETLLRSAFYQFLEGLDNDDEQHVIQIEIDHVPIATVGISDFARVVARAAGVADGGQLPGHPFLRPVVYRCTAANCGHQVTILIYDPNNPPSCPTHGRATMARSTGLGNP